MYPQQNQVFGSLSATGSGTQIEPDFMDYSDPVVVPRLFTVLPFIIEFFLASAYIYPAYLHWLIIHVIFSRKLCDTEICHIGKYLYFANTQIFNKYYKYFLIFLLIFLLFPFCHQ